MHLIWTRPARAKTSEPVDPRPTGVPVVDGAGAAFAQVRETGLNVGLYRVASADELAHVARDVLVLFAAYDVSELERAAGFVSRHATVVLGMGLGEHVASRALMLGALGYVHDGLSAVVLRDRFAEAVARHRSRLMRGRPLAMTA